MHESDSFINEVAEEVRRERLYRFLRKWGWLMAAVILLIVGGAAANEWRKMRSAAQAAATGDALRAAFRETDPTSRAGLLDGLATENPSAASIARLAAAGSLVEAGDTAGAGAALATLAGDADAAPVYRDLATLQRVMLLGGTLDPSERLAALETLTAPGAVFRPLALEQRALAHIDAGDTPRALEDLEAITTDPAAPEGVQTRAQQLMIALGGEPSAPGIAVPAEPADG